MTITRFDGPDAGDTSRGRNGLNASAGGVPVSAEERLAALRDLIATADTGGDVIHLAVTPTLRAALDGVSVPTEPGAPDPDVEALADLFMDLRLDGPALADWTYQQMARHYAATIIRRLARREVASSASTDRPDEGPLPAGPFTGYRDDYDGEAG